MIEAQTNGSDKLTDFTLCYITFGILKLITSLCKNLVSRSHWADRFFVLLYGGGKIKKNLKSGLVT